MIDTSTRPSWWRDVLVLAIAALVLRVAYLVAIVGLYGTQQTGDAQYMNQLGQSLATGQGFVLSGGGERIYNQSVGYPALLALLYWSFGPDVRTALAANAVLGVLSVGLVYALARALWHERPSSVPPRRVARLAGSLAALYPDCLLTASTLAAENLLVPLLMGTLLAATWRTPRDGVAGALTGALAAAAASVKALILFGFVVLPVVWVAARRRPFLRTLAATAAALLVLAPWTYVNYRDSGGYFVPFSVVAGEVFLDGNNPRARGKPSGIMSLGADAEAGLNKIEIDRLKLRRALAYIRERPEWYAQLLVLKFVHSLSPVRDSAFETPGEPRLFTQTLSRWVPTLFNAALLIGVVAGCIALRGQPVALAVAASQVTGALAVQLIFAAFTRYRFPFLFALLPHAALGMLSIVQLLRRRSRRAVAVDSPA
jgi:4-amino-4-deoxy-L-arabinose transferase-like glycosyltransferase